MSGTIPLILNSVLTGIEEDLALLSDRVKETT